MTIPFAIFPTKHLFAFLAVFLSFCDNMLQVVHEEFGIVEGLMTTVHATTGIQSLCAPNSFSLHMTLHCYDNVVVFNI